MQVFPRKILATAVLIASMAMLAGCEDKIEATSMPIMKASVQQVTKDMEPVEKVKFQQAFQTGMNYAYAKHHDGRTPEENVMGILGQMMGGIQGRNVDTSADDATEQEILKMMDGKTPSKIIGQQEEWNKELAKLKEQWQKAQDEIAANRQREMEERAKNQKLEFARQRKIQISQNIAQLESNIPVLEARISEAEIKKKPYTEAVADFKNVEIKNIGIKADGKRKRFVEFDVINNTQFTFNQILFGIDVNAGSTNITTKSGSDNFPGQGVTPGSTQHVSYSISASGAYKYAPSDLTVDVKFIEAADKGKNVIVAESLDDAGWKRWTENSYVSDKNNLEQVNKRIEDLKTQLAEMDKPEPSA